MPTLLITRLSLAAAALLAAYGWFVTAARAWTSLPFRYAYNYAEPAVAVLLSGMKAGLPLYPDFQTEPFLVNPYTPVYYLLSYAVLPFSEGVLPAGRLISFAAGVGVTFCIYRILRCPAVGAGRALSFVVAAGVVQLPCGFDQWYVMRPDLTGLAFSLAGVACFLAHESGGRPSRGHLYWLGTAFCLLAFMTKQNFLAAPGCYFLYLAAERRWKDLLRFGCVMTIVAGGLLLVFNGMTRGDFWLNQQLSIKKSFHPALLVHFWKNYLAVYWPLMVCAVAAFSQIRPKSPSNLLFFYLALAGLSTVTLGKVGADSNYFLELVAAAAIVTGLLLRRVPRWPGTLGVLVFAAYVFGMSGSAAGFRTESLRDKPHPLDEVVAVVKKLNGPVLAENLGILMAAGKPVVYEFYEFAQLSYAGVWDDRKILDRLDRREFGAVILETNIWKMKQTSRFTPALIESLRRNYRPVKIIAGQIICLPAPAAPAAGPAGRDVNAP